MRREEGAGHRHERVQNLIFEELRALMRDDVSDPFLSGVRIVAVLLSADYRHARVHFVLSVGGEQRALVDRVLRSLERATSFLRVRLADAIELKRVPDLRFVFDGAAAPNDGALGDGGSTPCSD